jgi:CBS domain-containing protein
MAGTAPMRIKDRPEFATKPRPLTMAKEATVAEAVAAMSDHDYGCIVVVDPAGGIEGLMTERDVLKRLVNRGRDARETRVADIMTSNPRVGRDTDDLLDWLRIMSNERFRRLPVIDDQGRLVAVMTQGDFVSYTWPDLVYQLPRTGLRSAPDTLTLLLIGGGIMLYTLVMILLLRTI